MKKKLTIMLVLICTLVIGLTACFGGGDNEGDGNNNPPKSLEFTLIDDDTAYSVSVGTVNEGDVVIPAEYEGKPVTTIANYGFSSKGAITSVTIPNSVTHIGDGAFMQCWSLANVVIPNSVVSIGEEAFRDCESLTSVVIPNSVVSIGTEAFYECKELENITMSNGIKRMGTGVFHETKWFNNATSDDGLIYIGKVLYYAYNTTPNSNGNMNYEIAEGTVVIASSVFLHLGYKLKSVIIPDSVESIGRYAFHENTGLTKIIIPSNVTFIAKDAFYGAMPLTIYVRGYTSTPSGWEEGWNPENRPVIWNYSGT